MVRCAWTRALAISGNAVIDDEEGGMTMTVRANGQGPMVDYVRGPNGRRRVDGELSVFGQQARRAAGAQ
jgi:hypothetical protein